MAHDSPNYYDSTAYNGHYPENSRTSFALNVCRNHNHSKAEARSLAGDVPPQQTESLAAAVRPATTISLVRPLNRCANGSCLTETDRVLRRCELRLRHRASDLLTVLNFIFKTNADICRMMLPQEFGGQGVQHPVKVVRVIHVTIVIDIEVANRIGLRPTRRRSVILIRSGQPR